MGSQIVNAIVSQVGRIITNPDGVSPDTSRPIEQLDSLTTKAGQSAPVEQVAELKTAKDGATEIARPIEQKGVLRFATAGVPGTDSVIEQRFLITKDGSEGPIEQLEFTTSTTPLQQVSTSSNIPQSQPIEQQDLPTTNIQITQFDFIELIFPPCNSIKNPIDTNILWRIRNFGLPYDTATLIFKVAGIEVQNTAEFTITPLVNGLQLDYNPPVNFNFDQNVVIFLRITDTAVPPNTFTFLCEWKTVPDVRFPFFQNIEPACDSTEVSVVADVEFDVLDIGLGVDLSSIDVTIEGVLVCSGLSFEAISVTSGTGYHVKYEHPDDPFRFDSQVTLGITASDLSPNQNSSQFICCFSTESSTAPEFVNITPEPCSSFVDNSTGLTFEVYGVENGVDITTLEVRVDNDLRKVFVRPRVRRVQ